MIQYCHRKIIKYAHQSHIFLFLSGLFLGYVGSRIMRYAFVGISTPRCPAVLVESYMDNFQNNSSHLLFVGVMTAQKFLDTRSYAIYKTWGQDIYPHIKIFGAENATTNTSMPLVRMIGVDDSYPPQKKSFSMLKYMYKYHVHQYRWFMRADDDIYVKVDRLSTLLNSINSSKPYFIGQAGQGTPEELGTLALEYNENFCMGGPGILISQETLRRVGPHLDTCLQDLRSTHEDVEIGRCIKRFAGISCTWSYEMQLVLYHNSSGNAAYTGKLKDKFVHNAITLHPVKQFQHLYRLRIYLLSLKVQDLMYDRILCHRDLSFIQLQTGHSHQPTLVWSLQHGNTSLFGVEPGISYYIPMRSSDIPTWTYVSKSYYSHRNSNPKVKIEGSVKEGFDDVIREVMQMTNSYSQDRGRMTEFKDFLYGYHRVDPLHSATYYLDLLLLYRKYRGHKMTINVRKHAYFQQTFSNLEIKEEDLNPLLHQPKLVKTKESNEGNLDFLKNVIKSVGVFTLGSEQELCAESKMIHMIVPLLGRNYTLSRFLEHSKKTLVGRDNCVSIMFVIFGTADDPEYNSNVKIIKEYQEAFPSLHIKLVHSNGMFSRSLALNLGASQCQTSDLLFFNDIDVLFTWPALHRLRYNTIYLKQVYYPIVFSEFAPETVYGIPEVKNHFLIDQNNGYWRQFGFGITSMYKSEFDTLGGFDQSIQGWGKEDVDLYNRFLKFDNITILRAPEPGLVHVYHEKICDTELSPKQLQMCMGTKSNTFASARYLASKILQRPKIFEYARKQKTSN